MECRKAERSAKMPRRRWAASGRSILLQLPHGPLSDLGIIRLCKLGQDASKPVRVSVEPDFVCQDSPCLDTSTATRRQELQHIMPQLLVCARVGTTRHSYRHGNGHGGIHASLDITTHAALTLSSAILTILFVCKSPDIKNRQRLARRKDLICNGRTIFAQPPCAVCLRKDKQRRFESVGAHGVSCEAIGENRVKTVCTDY